jgi:hypothetical protein
MGLKKGKKKWKLGGKVSVVRPKSHPYPVYLVNASDFIVVGVTQNGVFRSITPFGRTCSGDENACIDNHQYVGISSSDCGAPPYTLSIRIQDPRNGTQYETHDATITPTCDYAGEVDVFDAPLP